MASTPPIVSPIGYLMVSGRLLDSRTFSLRKHLEHYDKSITGEDGVEHRLLEHDCLDCAAYRRKVTKWDPLLFAVIYLSFALATRQTGFAITFSDAHLDAYRHALTWIVQQQPKGHRHAWFWPRGMGKSTMFFKILIMWAACHGHRKFAVAYGGSHRAAQKHLDFLRTQFATNPELRRDWTIDGVCQLDQEKIAGRKLTVDIALLCGFRMTAAGIDSQELGTTDEAAGRPDLILFDDVEKGEGTYSREQAKKRRITMTDTIFPVGDDAVVEYVGTVTMAGGIADQMLTQVRGGGDPKEVAWVADENLQVHLYEPIGQDPITGEEYSTWASRWSLAFLRSERLKAGITWFKNFMNFPASEESQWFLPQHFHHMEVDQWYQAHQPDLVICSVDPAAVENPKNDRWGMVTAAVNSRTGHILVLDARAGRWGPLEVRTNLQEMRNRYQFGLLLWETNMGGTYNLKSTLSKTGRIEDNFLRLDKRQIIPIHQGQATAFKESSYEGEQKTGRFQRMLFDYQQLPGIVWHALVTDPRSNQLVSAVPQLEGELLSFPNGMTKDVGDALSTLIWFARHRNPAKPTAGISRGW